MPFTLQSFYLQYSHLEREEECTIGARVKHERLFFSNVASEQLGTGQRHKMIRDKRSAVEDERPQFLFLFILRTFKPEVTSFQDQMCLSRTLRFCICPCGAETDAGQKGESPPVTLSGLPPNKTLDPPLLFNIQLSPAFTFYCAQRATGAFNKLMRTRSKDIHGTPDSRSLSFQKVI